LNSLGSKGETQSRMPDFSSQIQEFRLASKMIVPVKTSCQQIS